VEGHDQAAFFPVLFLILNVQAAFPRSLSGGGALAVFVKKFGYLVGLWIFRALSACHSMLLLRCLEWERRGGKFLGSDGRHL
jgi:hypothetical protein